MFSAKKGQPAVAATASSGKATSSTTRADSRSRLPDGAPTSKRHSRAWAEGVRGSAGLSGMTVISIDPCSLSDFLR